MSCLFRITETDPKDWKYVSEGGSTVVFSYAGPANPQFDRTVLRLQKVGISDSIARSSESPAEDLVDPGIIFHHTVISKLVPAQYLPHLEPVLVGRGWLLHLAQLCQAQRPQDRRVKDCVDVRCRKAVLATDFVGGPGWAVEIKPKWGFLPSPTYLSPSTRSIKTRTCRFCMHAHLKYTRGDIVACGYCPLDLYSGEQTRVRRALHALWNAWIGSSGRINNLRVFVGGKLLEPTFEPSSLRELALEFGSVSLSDNFVAINQLRDQFTAILLPIILETPVLHTLSTLQRTLDELDIEGLAALWTRARANGVDSPPPALGDGISQPTIDEWTRFISDYTSKIHTPGQFGKEPQVHELRYYCLAYLLSTTFKDCSIILRMRPLKEGVHHSCDNFDSSVTVIDLDVKSISRMQKWAKQDREIVETYAKTERHECQDRYRW
ncbi:Inositol-pentakisphosphate 2-kinase [Sparassis crispa]|uniref:Inositol-pentakisphosphate 2-kinase n=1 Tax=Sparassis crispa TaxID=139825 RepID=A0A401GHY0_9APHY|nr:Inositol-pentakisphosphate 2-kinase [Sparassis crispa]GBE81715.1 Inositol-pentakisphosphate 2-kinase [Sparassis crispa]